MAFYLFNAQAFCNIKCEVPPQVLYHLYDWALCVSRNVSLSQVSSLCPVCRIACVYDRFPQWLLKTDKMDESSESLSETLASEMAGKGCPAFDMIAAFRRWKGTAIRKFTIMRTLIMRVYHTLTLNWDPLGSSLLLVTYSYFRFTYCMIYKM